MFLRRRVASQGSQGPEDSPRRSSSVSAEKGVDRGALAVKAPSPLGSTLRAA